MIDNNTDLTGMQFNEWTVLYRDFEKENEEDYYKKYAEIAERELD